MLMVPTARPGGRKRLSNLLVFRTKSDSHLATTAKQHSERPPTMPGPDETPAIMRTAPTQDEVGVSSKRRSTFLLPRRPKTPKKPQRRQEAGSQTSTPRVTFDGGDGASESSLIPNSPPTYDDAAGSQLAVPLSRVSDSSRSDGSSGDHTIYGQTTTVTQTTHTTTTFFKLPRRKRRRARCFRCLLNPNRPRLASGTRLTSPLPPSRTGTHSL